MSIEQDLAIEPVTSRKRVNRTRRIVILTPRDTNKYEIIGTREQYVLVNGVRSEEEGDVQTIRRMLADVATQTVQVGGKTLSAGEIGVAISKFFDRWSAEDKAIEDARIAAEQAVELPMVDPV